VPHKLKGAPNYWLGPHRPGSGGQPKLRGVSLRIQGHALRARRAARPEPSSEHGRGSPSGGAEERAGGPPPGQGWNGPLAAGGRQPGPPPLARQRTGAGRCRHAVSPAPARRRSPPSRTPQWPHLQALAGQSSRAGHPVAAKAPSQGHAVRRVPSLRSGQTLDWDLTRQRSAPVGRAGQSEAAALRLNERANMESQCV
jgi:hypothetical protein